MFFRKRIIEEPVTGLLLSLPKATPATLVEWALAVRERLVEVARSRSAVGHRIDLAQGWVRISAPTLAPAFWRELVTQLARALQAEAELFLYRASDSGTDDRLERVRDGEKGQVLLGAMSPFELGSPGLALQGKFREVLEPIGIRSRVELLHEESATHAAPPLPVVAAFVEVDHADDELRSTVHDALTGIDAEADVVALREELLMIDPGEERFGLTAPLSRVSMLGGVRRLHAVVYDEAEPSYEGFWTATNGTWSTHAFIEHGQDLDFLRLTVTRASLRERSQHVWREWPLSQLAEKVRFKARRVLVESRGALEAFDLPFPVDVAPTSVPVRYQLEDKGLAALDAAATEAGASISSLLEQHLEPRTQEDLTRTVVSLEAPTPTRELTVFLRPPLHKRLLDTAAALGTRPAAVLQGAIEAEWLK